MTDGTPRLRQADDDSLLDMYAHYVGDEHCDALAAERGIEVSPCKYQHRVGTIVGRFETRPKWNKRRTKFTS